MNFMKKSSLVKYFKYFHHYFIVLYDLAHNNSKLHTANISTYLYIFEKLRNEKKR